MDQSKASERTMFKIGFRREMIDTAERRIEHEKSMIKNYKAQIKVLQGQWDEQRKREERRAYPDFAGDFAKAMTKAGAVGYG